VHIYIIYMPFCLSHWDSKLTATKSHFFPSHGSRDPESGQIGLERYCRSQGKYPISIVDV